MLNSPGLMKLLEIWTQDWIICTLLIKDCTVYLFLISWKLMFVSHKRTHNLFNLTNLGKNSVIDNMDDDLPSTQDHHKRPALVDERLQDLLYKQALRTSSIPGLNLLSRKSNLLQCMSNICNVRFPLCI